MLMVCYFLDSLRLEADRHCRVVAPVALVELDVGGAGIPLARVELIPRLELTSLPLESS